MIDGGPDMDSETMKEIFKISEIIERLEKMQRCSDEIPKEIIHIGDYKCRKNWWQYLIEEIQSVILAEIFTDEKINAIIRDFIITYTSEEFKKKERITRDDINNANEIIAWILELLRQIK